MDPNVLHQKPNFVQKALDANKEVGYTLGKSGNTAMMGAAIDRGVDMSYWGYIGALSADDAPMIKYLRDRGVKVGDGVQFTPYYKASVETVVALMDADVDGVCDFQMAPYLLHCDKLPLDERVRILIRKEYVHFAYDLAVKTGNIPVIHKLIAAGVPFSHKVDYNMLITAYANGHKYAITELFKVPNIKVTIRELDECMNAAMRNTDEN